MIKLTSRGSSATADAYLSPVVKRYVEGFRKGFKGELRSSNAQCEFMQSDGGLANSERYLSSRLMNAFRTAIDSGRFSGLRAILSGPAGGVVGYARTSYDEKDNTPVIGYIPIHHHSSLADDET